MTVVLDANVVVVAATPDPRQAAAAGWLERWHREAQDLHAPQLFTYEVASALAHLQWARHIAAASAGYVWDLVEALDLALHPPSGGAELLVIAHRLRRRSACDAAYIDVALQLGAELWTFDVTLARNAASLGYPVRLMV